jgi:prolyl 4-hydroxylase
VSVVVHFSRDLGTWLVEGLGRGEPPAALVGTMAQNGMDASVARAIVDAFLVARSAGKPVPTDSVTFDERAADYVEEGPIWKAGARVVVSDRTLRVTSRLNRPVLAVLSGLLEPEDCAEVIRLARPRLAPSTVVDPATGRDVVASHRTSFGMFFRLAETPFIEQLDRRFSEAMNLPVEHGEGFQVLFYPEGAESTPHVDFLRPSNDANRASTARSGQRVSTLIAYLNDVDRGGETTFPAVGFSVAPILGNGVLIEYGNRLGQVDEQSVHAGSKVLAGEKWVLTKWMRERRFVPAEH